MAITIYIWNKFEKKGWPLTLGRKILVQEVTANGEIRRTEYLKAKNRNSREAEFTLEDGETIRIFPDYTPELTKKVNYRIRYPKEFIYNEERKDIIVHTTPNIEVPGKDEPNDHNDNRSKLIFPKTGYPVPPTWWLEIKHPVLDIRAVLTVTNPNVEVGENDQD